MEASRGPLPRARGTRVALRLRFHPLLRRGRHRGGTPEEREGIALEVDPRYYDGLWVLSDACCPGWHFPPDPANRDSYAGNGYFGSWAADMARGSWPRQESTRDSGVGRRP